MGDGSRGQLGNGEDVQKCKRPELVSFFKKKIIVQVSAGECQTAFLTDTHEIFTCGDNRHGKLGLDQKKFNSIQFYPHLVEKYRQLKVINVRQHPSHQNHYLYSLLLYVLKRLLVVDVI